ncbi:hypothetical protein A8F94_21830 [Bacillus sp. FJAT-27225]|uniref:DUF3231 family protein n=1 Tax=Bacillus sp. FJAT-27225 TaxID=1743144 RepID=UPI00080C234B|nr:DUF3231 family protein [Bacillus sp. FJAT-27225]OCA81519.1 hypothetical protein A8F94_21830 [Bacillus sp. FJAT-27225]
MGILSGNPKNEPLHYGEVYGMWSFVAGSKAMTAGYQTFLNHIGDDDLKKLVEENIATCKEHEKRIEEILKENGVALPPTPPERPLADLEQIPPGARLMDNEIAMASSADIAAGLVMVSGMIGNCIREDIAMLFGEIHASKLQLGARFLRLNKEKGWLIPPPLHMMKPAEE